MDPVKNFAKVTVSGGYNESAVTIVLSSGHGAKLPDPSTDGAFNLVWFNATDYADPSDDPNIEIVRCTARTVDTLTVTRGQEGIASQTHNISGKVYKMILSLTKKMADDLAGLHGLAIDSRDYTSINAAVAAIGSTQTTLLISDAQILTASLTIPSTLKLIPLKGGSVVKASTFTLTINGQFEAGLYQVFSGFSAGDVTFGAGSIKEVHPEWWGENANPGITDMQPSFTKAAASLGIMGGKIIVPYGKVLIDTALTIPKNVTLQGPYNFVGYPTNAAGTEALLGSKSAIIINSLVTITLESAAGIEGCLIYRKDMTFPANDATAFAGTAITLGRDTSFVRNCMILGFNKLIYGSSANGVSIHTVYGDGLNGIEIINSNDVSRITDVHLWPFVTYFGTTPNHKRSGTGFKINTTTTGDWTKLNHCFAFGYYVGFDLINVTACSLISCGADQVAGHTNSVGFQISGSSTLISLIGCQAGGEDFAGYYFNHTGNHVQLIGCQSWASTNFGVAIGNTGNSIILGGYINGASSGIYINNATPTIIIDGVRFNTISNAPIVFAVANPNVIIGKNDYTNFSGNPVSGSTLRDVASAATITLPSNGDIFNITGTTAITSVTPLWAGKIITLKFADILTFTDGLNLKLAGNFVTSADDTISLICDGTNWYEIGRSVN